MASFVPVCRVTLHIPADYSTRGNDLSLLSTSDSTVHLSNGIMLVARSFAMPCFIHTPCVLLPIQNSYLALPYIQACNSCHLKRGVSTNNYFCLHVITLYIVLLHITLTVCTLSIIFLDSAAHILDKQSSHQIDVAMIVSFTS